MALKLRVHCFRESGERLENLVNQLFKVGKDLDLVCGVLRVLLNISGEIYRDVEEVSSFNEENQNFEYDDKEEEEEEEKTNWSQYTPTSIYSQVENSICTLTPNFSLSPKFEAYSQLLMITTSPPQTFTYYLPTTVYLIK